MFIYCSKMLLKFAYCESELSSQSISMKMLSHFWTFMVMLSPSTVIQPFGVGTYQQIWMTLGW
jgi:hypothetical protein